jgi:antirestriction protein ArdC
MNNSVVVPTAVNNSITVNPRRAELKLLSNSLKQLAAENQTSINAALVFFYSEQTGVASQDFKTLEAWNTMGYMVKKGEKSYSIWGQLTKKTINLEEGRIAGEPDVIEFYPIISLFSIDQVLERKKKLIQQAKTVESTPMPEVIESEVKGTIAKEVKEKKATKGKKKELIAVQA